MEKRAEKKRGTTGVVQRVAGLCRVNRGYMAGRALDRGEAGERVCRERGVGVQQSRNGGWDGQSGDGGQDDGGGLVSD